MTHPLVENPKKNFFELLVKYWPLIVAIFIAIVGWKNITDSGASNSDRITKLENRMASVDTNQLSILTQLSQIQTDVQWIKRNFQK